MLILTNKIFFKLCTLSKVGWSKPGMVLTGCNCPGQYSRSGQYWSIELFGGYLKNGGVFLVFTLVELI